MRKLLALVVAILLLAIAAGGVLLAVVDPNDHKAMVESFASEALGRPVRIEGAIEIKPALTPTLVARDVRIGAPQGDATTVAIDRAEVSVVLTSLLFGPIHLPRIAIDTAQVDLPLSPGASSSSARDDRAPQIDQIALSDIALRYHRDDGEILSAMVKSATLEPTADRSATRLALSGDLDKVPFEVTGTTGSIEDMFAAAQHWPLRIDAKLGEADIAATGSLGFADRDGLSYQFDVEVDLPASARLAADLDLPSLPLKASARISTEKGTIQVRELSAKLGESDISGSLTLRPGTRAALNGKLTLKHVRLAELLSDSSIGKGLVPNVPLPLPAQVPIDLDLSATIGQLDFPGQPLTDVTATLSAGPQQLALDVDQSKLGKGSVNGRYAVKTTDGANQVALQLDAADLDLPALFDDLKGASRLPKDVGIKIGLSGAGTDLHAFLGSANGPIGITTGAAVIDGTLADMLGRSLFTALVPHWKSSPSAKIICTVLNLDAKDGKAGSTALVIDTERVVVGGGGAIELATGKMDFLLLPKAKDATLLPLVAPVHLSGTIADPRVKTDASDLLSGAGHLLLGIVNPLSLVTPILHPGLDGKTPCETATLPAAERENLFERAQGEASDAVKEVGRGIGSGIERIGEAAKEALDDATE